MKQVTDIKDLYAALLTIREGAIYNIFGQILLHEAFKEFFKNGKIPKISQVLPEGELTLEGFIKRHAIGESDNLLHLKQNVQRDTTKHVLKETFRLTQSFFDKSDYGVFSKQGFYDFTKIMVNSLSHDFTIKMSKKDEKKLPISYNGYTITKDNLNRKYNIKLSHLLILNDEVIKFVDSQQRIKE